MDSAFKVFECDTYLHLEFSVPSTANALSLQAAQDLSSIQKRYADWERPVLVTASSGRLFCSGGNLSDYKKLKGKAAGLKVNRQIEKSLNHFGKWNVVKLAVIEGDVLGGGMEWLARFDFRWSTPEVVLAFWQRRIGLSTGWGGGSAWARIIGEEQVRRLLLEGRLLSAPEALRLGLLNRVLPAWQIRKEAVSWLSQLHKPSITTLTKWSVAREAKTFSSLWMGTDHARALHAWKAKK